MRASNQKPSIRSKCKAIEQTFVRDPAKQNILAFMKDLASMFFTFSNKNFNLKQKNFS